MADVVVVVDAVFDRDVAPWEGDPGVILAWNPEDARGTASSGSLSVSNENAASGAAWVFGVARRCAPAVENAIYAVEGSVFIRSGQGAGGAGLGVSFFRGKDCTAATGANYDTPPTDKVDAWIRVSGETTSPPGTSSIQVRVVVPKPLSEPSFEARFDDVRVTQR